MRSMKERRNRYPGIQTLTGLFNLVQGHRQWTYIASKTFIERTKETHPSYADIYIDKDDICTTESDRHYRHTDRYTIFNLPPPD
jgi:hypothetical protein